MTQRIKSGLDVRTPSDGLVGLARGVIVTGSHRKGMELTRSMDAALKAPKILEFPLEKRAQVQESQVLASLVSPRKGAKYLMLDIGSHSGESAKHFRKIGWSIHCIEDNLRLRRRLTDAMANYARAAVDYRILEPEHAPRTYQNDKQGSEALVYTSIRDILRERHTTRLDVLKVHGGGRELNTLRSVPWTSITLDFVECKFDNSRSEAHALTGDRIATFLIERGYTVYVSEWHRVDKRSASPSWHRVFRYPQDHFSNSASGQILGFRNDPGLEAVSKAFEKHLNFPASKDVQPNPRPKKNEGRLTAPEKTVHEILPASDPTSPENPSLTRYFAARSARLAPMVLLMLGFPAAAFFLLSENATFMAAFLLLFIALAAPLTYVALRSFSHITRLNRMLSQQSQQLENIFSQPNTRNRLRDAVKGVLGERPYSEFVRVGELAKSRTSLEKSIQRLETQNEATSVIAKSAERNFGQIEERHTTTHNALLALSNEFETIAQTLIKQRAAEQNLAAQIASLQDQLTNNYALASSVGEIAEIISELDLKLSNTQEEFKDGLSARLNEFSGRVEGFAIQQDTLDVALEGVRNELSRVHSVSDTLKLQISQQKYALNHLSRWSAFDNKKWYQRFNRRLEKRHIEELRTSWSDRLGVSISAKSLGYMATRVEMLESQLDGRLATSVQDMILRTLIARSVNSHSLDVLEIGTLFGIGAAIMFDHTVHHFDRVHYTLLDPLDGYYKRGQSDGPTDLPVSEFQLRRNMERVGCNPDQYSLIKHLSTQPEGMEAAAHRQYDVLVIDGDHTYAGVKIDFVNFLRFVKVGGLIIFDDYASDDWPDVKAFVDREVEPMPNMARVGSSWRTCVYRKTQEV